MQEALYLARTTSGSTCPFEGEKEKKKQRKEHKGKVTWGFISCIIGMIPCPPLHAPHG
jgi:hypothetical protein